MKYIMYILMISGMIWAESCSENPQESPATSNYLLYQKPGLIDSITGTCSTYLIRNFTLDSIDFSHYDKAVFEKNSFTDGDLSGIQVYYLTSDTAVNVIDLQGRVQINTTSFVEFQPPKRKEKYYLRMKLYSSVCTGQLFYLKLRDMKIYGVK
ncbi:MAG: hypothetical protein NTY74_15595 [Ignavibacteriae bacterium]|nr:hypothetical protein [Ignavibacteriota bacterium]